MLDTRYRKGDMTAVPETMPRRAAGRRGETPCRRDIERESGMRRSGTNSEPGSPA
ncbi:hypothetical protein [Actinophytocola sp.]|uniref:hypothetical protein n=1 Tax=Actinophytocola sp. TaxID=1872138 RepID=UPI002D507200|nr:hypothetical protein [Actinophytocola sp.]HYQ65333.1 hypothetical protein [Actinophytocola sp.]